MKKYTYSLLAAALACGVAQAAATAYTTPVGYTTSSLISSAYSPTDPKYNFLAPDLQNPASWSGTVSAIVGDQITLQGAAFTPSAYDKLTSFAVGSVYAYCIETADGYWAQVESNDATSVTVEAGAGANFTVGDQITLRRHVTINDYFGATNQTGLLANNDGDIGAADNIILIDEVNNTSVTIFACNLIGGTWITDGFEEAGIFPIYPDQGLQVLRRGNTNLDLVYANEVDTNGRQIQVSTGFQIRPKVLPVDTTLSQLALHTGNPATGLADDGGSADISQADTVVVIVDGNSTTYFYSTLDLGGGEAGWYTDGFDFSSNTVLPAGAALLIYRNNPTNSSPFIWVNPAPVINP